MNKLNEILNTYVTWAIYALLIVTLINGCNGCNSNREVSRLRKETTNLVNTIDSLKSNTYSKDELNIRLEILSLESEKSTLFNVNYIVLTKERPDTRMNKIDGDIKVLTEKLNNTK